MSRQGLISLVLLSAGLLFGRMVYTHHFSFAFLLWNLFLAYVPYYLISQFYSISSRYGRHALFLLSILFLPNAPYIVTDLFHLKANLAAPIWLDLILILSFALVGLLLFLNTVRKMVIIIENDYFRGRSVSFLFKALVMILSAYGIYLGRVLRFNSWDIVTDPLNLFHRMVQSLFDRGYFKETIAMTFTFSVFLFIIYEIYENMLTKTNKAPLYETKI